MACKKHFHVFEFVFQKYPILGVTRQIRYRCNFAFTDVTEKALSPAFTGPLWPRGHCVHIATSKSKDSDLCPRSIIVCAVWFLNEILIYPYGVFSSFSFEWTPNLVSAKYKRGYLCIAQTNLSAHVTEMLLHLLQVK